MNKSTGTNVQKRLDFSRLSPDNPGDLINLAKIFYADFLQEINLIKTCDYSTDEEDIFQNIILGLLEAFKKESALKKKFLKMNKKVNPEIVDTTFRYNLFKSWVRARLFSSFNQNNFARIVIHKNGSLEELSEKEYLRRKKKLKKLEEKNEVVIISCRKTIFFEELNNNSYSNRSPEEQIKLENPEITTGELLENSSDFGADDFYPPDYSTNPEELLIQLEEAQEKNRKKFLLQLLLKTSKK